MTEEPTMIFSDLNQAASFLKGWFVLAVVTAALAAFSAAPSNAAAPKQAVIAVRGMSCPICAHRLEKVLAKLPGAEKARVDLEKSQAVVDFASNSNVTDKEIGQKVRDSGFIPGRIEWRAIDKEKAK